MKQTRKHQLKKKSKRIGFSKKQRGGVAFNAHINWASLDGDFYPYNSQLNNPQNPSNVTDARLLNCTTANNPVVFGGKKGKKARKQKKTKRKGKKGKRSRKQRGGANPLNYSYLTGLSTQNTSLPLAFGTTSGTDYINKTLNAQPIPSNAMSYESPFPTLA
tara:strand:+ start:5218 stop:5700 length:483 start_codon:yes stop_codon:yes gene_type:complete